MKFSLSKGKLQKNNRIKHCDNQFILLDLVIKTERKIGLIIDAWFVVSNHHCQACLTQIVNLIENSIDKQRQLIDRSSFSIRQSDPG